MSTRRVVEYVGADLPFASYWYWTWGGPPQVHTLTKQERAHVRALLADALPFEVASDSDEVLSWRADAEIPQKLRAAGPAQAIIPLQRLLTGPLADPDREQAFSSGLADALLPPALRSELLDAGRTGERVEFRVRPAPSASAVPWELLPVADGIRLLDVANIVTVPAPLRRESRPPGDADAPRRWSEREDRPVLRVIDPFPPARVLSPLPAWPGGAANDVNVVQPLAFDRIDLSRMLHEAPSRLLYVGHVTSQPGDAKATGMMLACRGKVFGHGTIPPDRPRPFTAEDLARGTASYGALVGATAHQPRVPDAARSASGVLELPGEHLWPMPPRVALIACASGGDLAHVEPFGLVSAVLDAGAEVVTATRWTLPTDLALTLFGATGKPMLDAILAIDRIQATDDPIRALGEWQRERLDQWRTSRRVNDAPVLWASFTHHDGRYRRVPLPDAPAP